MEKGNLLSTVFGVVNFARQIGRLTGEMIETAPHASEFTALETPDERVRRDLKLRELGMY